MASEWRRQGIGVDLVGAVREWSEQVGAERLILWVVDTNTPAVTLYGRCGFTETGETQPLRSNDTLTEIKLAMPLAGMP